MLRQHSHNIASRFGPRIGEGNRIPAENSDMIAGPSWVCLNQHHWLANRLREAGQESLLWWSTGLGRERIRNRFASVSVHTRPQITPRHGGGRPAVESALRTVCRMVVYKLFLK